MILGIGADLANIDRIGRTIDRFGRRFLDRVYTETEQAISERRAERTASYAKRWAAKEACSKALGTGLRMGIAWKDMGVVNLRTGQPTLALTGWARHLRPGRSGLLRLLRAARVASLYAGPRLMVSPLNGDLPADTGPSPTPPRSPV